MPFGGEAMRPPNTGSLKKPRNFDPKEDDSFLTVVFLFWKCCFWIILRYELKSWSVMEWFKDQSSSDMNDLILTSHSFEPGIWIKMSREKVGIIDTTPQKFDEEIPKMAGLKRSHLHPKNHFESSRHQFLGDTLHLFCGAFQSLLMSWNFTTPNFIPQKLCKDEGISCLLDHSWGSIAYIPSHVNTLNDRNKFNWSYEHVHSFQYTWTTVFGPPLRRSMYPYIPITSETFHSTTCGWHPAKAVCNEKGLPKTNLTDRLLPKMSIDFCWCLSCFISFSPAGSPTCPLKPWL